MGFSFSFLVVSGFLIEGFPSVGNAHSIFVAAYVVASVIDGLQSLQYPFSCVPFSSRLKRGGRMLKSLLSIWAVGTVKISVTLQRYSESQIIVFYPCLYVVNLYASSLFIS